MQVYLRWALPVLAPLYSSRVVVSVRDTDETYEEGQQCYSPDLLGFLTVTQDRSLMHEAWG